MIFIETTIPGAFVIQPEAVEDDRGFFARTWCQREFARRGLNPNLVQCSISFNKAKGTLRGMHYQAPPHEEAKLVRCTTGAIYDVILDLRSRSAAFRKWISIEMTSANHTMLYIPEGVAHGFQTLADDVEVCYQMTEFHFPGYTRGVPYDDPAYGISWPLPVTRISKNDQSWPLAERFPATDAVQCRDAIPSRSGPRRGGERTRP